MAAQTLLLAQGLLESESSLDCVINPRKVAALGSPEQGILSEILVSRGARVSKGDVLATLDNVVESKTAEMARLRAETDVAIRSSKLQHEFRVLELNRLEELRQDQAVPQSSYDEAEIESRLAEMAVEDAEVNQKLAIVEYERANAALERRRIRSPFDGIVVNILQAPGEYVHEQSQLMELAEVDPLHVEVFLPVEAYGSVEEGMSAEVRPEQPIGGSYSALVTVVDTVFDAASRTFGVRLELTNPNYELPAGLRCTVSFLASSKTGAADN